MTRSAPDLSIPVGVVVERRKAVSPWIDAVWRPVAVLPGAPDTPPWTRLDGDDEAARFYAGATLVSLFRGDTAQYRDNLATGAPLLWVVLQPTDGEPPYALQRVTADPSEGEASIDGTGALVEAVAMPEPVREALASFVATHHVEQSFFKRKRSAGDPDALARRGARNKPRDER